MSVLTDMLHRKDKQVTTQVDPHDAPPAAVTPRQLRRRAVTKIVEENGCTKAEAFNMLDWLNRFVEKARDKNYEELRPRTGQMQGRNYEIFDAIMPHGQAPETGTAADLVNDALLDRTRGETYILHDQKRVFDRVYCSVAVQILAIQVS